MDLAPILLRPCEKLKKKAEIEIIGVLRYPPTLLPPVPSFMDLAFHGLGKLPLLLLFMIF